MNRLRSTGALLWLWALCLTVLLLWPLRLSGYPLGRDMVFTPRQPLDADALGVSSAPPRAVPVDALVALIEHLVDGAVVGRIALAVPLLLAGLGAAAVLRELSPPARALACGLAIWNPFVVERLALGQWSLLWGYAALFWIVCELRRGAPRPAYLVLPIAAASITPTGGVLACLLVLTWAVLRRGGAVVVTAAVLLQAPWLVAAALSTAASTSDPAAVAAFASRSEFGGAVVSLLGFGGIWNAAVVPPSRAGVLALVTVLIVLLAAVSGRRRLARALGPVARPLLVAAVVGFVLAAAAALPGGEAVMRTLVAHLPGGGLLRDAQKWLAPFVVLAVLLVAVASDRVVRRLRAPLPLVAALALPLVLLPDATRAVWPTLTPAHYPAGYDAVADRVRTGGDVVVAPFQPYRAFAWHGDRPSYDPAPRLLDTTVVLDDRLQVAGRLLAGEDPRAARIGALLASGRPTALGAEGVGWVLVEKQTPGTVPRLAGLRLVLADADVALYRVPGPIADADPARWRVITAALVFAAWVAAVLAAVAACVAPRLRRRRGVSAR